jgi:hypothetical protein
MNATLILLFIGFGALPDVALFLGIGRGLQRGQLHPRAVGLYNALHRPWGPVALTAAAIVDPVLLAGAAGWAVHIAIDRLAGYRLRTPDGFIRA